MTLSTVSMFNADTSTVNVIVNNGTSFTIAGTSSAILFIPQSPAIPPPFSLKSPSPGIFGLGTNSLTITPANAQTPATFEIVIPTAPQLISLQLYILWESEVSAGYVLLNNGSLIGSSFVPWSSSP